MSTLPTPLKYLFEAEFGDGTICKQNKDDLPTHADHGSAFTDILDKLDDLKCFTLIEQAIFPHKYCVDLTDGHFSIDGVSFAIQGQILLPDPKPMYRLVFFRDVSKFHSTPARFANPHSMKRNHDGSLDVIDQRGMLQHFPQIENVWEEHVTVMIDGTETPMHYLWVLPTPPSPQMTYRLGWQTTIAGKNYQETIVIE